MPCRRILRSFASLRMTNLRSTSTYDLRSMIYDLLGRLRERVRVHHRIDLDRLHRDGAALLAVRRQREFARQHEAAEGLPVRELGDLLSHPALTRRSQNLAGRIDLPGQSRAVR